MSDVRKWFPGHCAICRQHRQKVHTVRVKLHRRLFSVCAQCIKSARAATKGDDRDITLVAWAVQRALNARGVS